MPPVFSTSSLKETLKKLGYADLDNPSVINLYAASFEDKDAVGAAIFLLVLIGSVVWDVTPVLFVILAGITGVVCRVLLKKGASV